MTVRLAPLGSLAHFLLHLRIVAARLHVTSGLWSGCGGGRCVWLGLCDPTGHGGTRALQDWPQCWARGQDAGQERPKYMQRLQDAETEMEMDGGWEEP